MWTVYKRLMSILLENGRKNEWEVSSLKWKGDWGRSNRSNILREIAQLIELFSDDLRIVKLELSDWNVRSNLFPGALLPLEVQLPSNLRNLDVEMFDLSDSSQFERISNKPLESLWISVNGEKM